MADVTTNRRPHPFLVALAVVGALALIAVSSVLGLVGLAISKVPGVLAGRMGTPC